MTKIKLHGILAKEFGENFEFEISSPKEIIKAIDTNFEGFQNRVNELYQDGLHYTLIVDGELIQQMDDFVKRQKISEIHMVPMIVGSGFIAAIGAAISAAIAGISAAVAAIGSTLAAIGGAIMSGITAIGGAIGSALGGIGTALASSGGFGGFLGQLAIGVASIGLQMLLAPKEASGTKTPAAALPAAANASSTALQESFAFSNRANLAVQGSVVPLGYGRLKIGSQVIMSVVKSYPQNINSITAMSRGIVPGSTAAQIGQ